MVSFCLVISTDFLHFLLSGLVSVSLDRSPDGEKNSPVPLSAELQNRLISFFPLRKWKVPLSVMHYLRFQATSPRNPSQPAPATHLHHPLKRRCKEKHHESSKEEEWWRELFATIQHVSSWLFGFVTSESIFQMSVFSTDSN